MILVKSFHFSKHYFYPTKKWSECSDLSFKIPWYTIPFSLTPAASKEVWLDLRFGFDLWVPWWILVKQCRMVVRHVASKARLPRCDSQFYHPVLPPCSLSRLHGQTESCRSSWLQVVRSGWMGRLSADVTGWDMGTCAPCLMGWYKN